MEPFDFRLFCVLVTGHTLRILKQYIIKLFTAVSSLDERNKEGGEGKEGGGRYMKRIHEYICMYVHIIIIKKDYKLMRLILIHICVQKNVLVNECIDCVYDEYNCSQLAYIFNVGWKISVTKYFLHSLHIHPT